MGKLRIAVIGTGNIARQHVEAILACGQELAGVCNHNIEKAMLFLSSLASGREGVAPAVLEETVFDSVPAMLDTVKPDLVYIATPHRLTLIMPSTLYSAAFTALSKSQLIFLLQRQLI